MQGGAVHVLARSGPCVQFGASNSKGNLMQVERLISFASFCCRMLWVRSGAEFLEADFGTQI